MVKLILLGVVCALACLRVFWPSAIVEMQDFASLPAPAYFIET